MNGLDGSPSRLCCVNWKEISLIRQHSETATMCTCYFDNDSQRRSYSILIIKHSFIHSEFRPPLYIGTLVPMYYCISLALFASNRSNNRSHALSLSLSPVIVTYFHIIVELTKILSLYHQHFHSFFLNIFFYVFCEKAF